MPQPGDLFERFGWRGADATERPLRAAVVRALKGGSPSPRREKMKKLFTIFAMSGSLLILSACNTVEGAGEDVESAADCADRSEEHTSELQSLMRTSYSVFCLKKKKHNTKTRDK